MAPCVLHLWQCLKAVQFACILACHVTASTSIARTAVATTCARAIVVTVGLCLCLAIRQPDPDSLAQREAKICEGLQIRHCLRVEHTQLLRRALKSIRRMDEENHYAFLVRLEDSLCARLLLVVIVVVGLLLCIQVFVNQCSLPERIKFYLVKYLEGFFFFLLCVI